jgi:hypothetical protein
MVSSAYGRDMFVGLRQSLQSHLTTTFWEFFITKLTKMLEIVNTTIKSIR